MKEEKFPCTGKLPHRWDQEGAVEPQRAMQKWEPRRQNTEKAALLGP